MLTRIGMWAWGSVTVLLAFASLAVVVLGGFTIEVVPGKDVGYMFQGAPTWLPGMYVALKEQGSLVAGILGFSGLAWAHFYGAVPASKSLSNKV